AARRSAASTTIAATSRCRPAERAAASLPSSAQRAPRFGAYKCAPALPGHPRQPAPDAVRRLKKVFREAPVQFARDLAAAAAAVVICLALSGPSAAQFANPTVKIGVLTD